jgi:hypothetical protein
VSPMGGSRPADIRKHRSELAASSFVFNGHEARTTPTTIVYTRSQHDRPDVGRCTMMPFSRCAHVD